MKEPILSQLYWEKHSTYKKTALTHHHKPTYDKLLALEAKIEFLERMYKYKKVFVDDYKLYLFSLEAELQQIKEQENLK